MSGSERVVVVGGGVIGAACAHYLARAGCSVTVVEQGTFGGGCSHANCGYVCPSHVLPLAAPGALWSTLRTLLMPNSPLKVRFRFDPAMWAWFWKFARNCNRRKMFESAQAIHSLLSSSRALYDELVHGTLDDFEWEELGLLFVFHSKHAFDHYAATDRLLRDEFGVGATRYDAHALQQLEPALRPELAGAWHYETDAHLRPDRLMGVWRQVLQTQGVEIREGCPLLGIEPTGRLVKTLVTGDGKIEADQVVVATGAWTPQLAWMLRSSIPIQPGKGYSITMARPQICPRRPMIFEEHRVAITPMDSMFRIGSTMEFAGYDTRLNPRRLQLLRDGAELYLRLPKGAPELETWYGWRPMTPDSLPYIGRVPAYDNLYVAAGHGMLGVSMSPGTGKLIAEIVTGTTPHLDIKPFAVGRK